GLWIFFRNKPSTTQWITQPSLLHIACGSLFGIGLCCPSLGKLDGMRAIGRISYGLYLYHLPIYASLGLASSGVTVAPWRGISAITLTFAAAAVSFKMIEAPILRYVRMNDRKFRGCFGPCTV